MVVVVALGSSFIGGKILDLCFIFFEKKQILVHLLYKLRREDLQFVTNSCDNQMRVRFFFYEDLVL